MLTKHVANTLLPAVSLAAVFCSGQLLFAQATNDGQRPTQKALEKELKASWKKWIDQDVFGFVAPADEPTTVFDKWLDQDVRYIITDAERHVFQNLKTDEERQQFIQLFWLRLDPTPDTKENEFKEEHYRRIAYANEHFSSSTVEGWKTDRGKNYILYGTPDAPGTVWRTDGTCIGVCPSPLPEPMNEFTQLERYVAVMKSPAPKFKDLAAAVNSDLRYTTLPMQVRTDYIRVTDATVYANIMVQFKNSDIHYATEDKIAKSTIRIYGRITTPTRRLLDWFEDTVTQEIPAEMLPDARSRSQVYSKHVVLMPGTYRLDIVAQDQLSNTLNTFATALNVPQ